MTLTDAQRETVTGLERKGFHYADESRPCECGPEDYKTTTKEAFSDSLVFHHTCVNCGNKFRTWIEG